mmetsp:Transcript_34415/g.76992  ORF Transcript_34415/g.76992 Transcript_34415/m.76992 type:complete len:84 (-) Transcript_34415:98-349(-)
MNAAGVIAERENHHPDFHLTDYRHMEVVIWTHKLGCLTENDFQLAAMVDEIPVSYSPKWLKEEIARNPALEPFLSNKAAGAAL